ncbi:HAD-IC family P-type ATPase [Nonomuraea zeae]|uniref:HAD-IC family P-type ATPase n=1 Tax=Nonomuraea zeae TaxID=1642303 RepID=UPI001F0D0081|nr:HAD-IC family P-type ATPase [Nonomuraea zeae]
MIAVATRDAPGQDTLTPADEHDLAFRGLLVFLDPPKAGARDALGRLAELGITVKVLTGDNPAVAAKLCADLGLPAARVLTGADVEAADDARLAELIDQTTIFARISPQHKARIVRVQRRSGLDVAFLGDGVNDAIALHAADVGISVDSATDVAKDAADVLLLEQNLAIPQTLVIFAIRTRRVPFFRSHPSLPLLPAALGVVSVGALLPATPIPAARLVTLRSPG